MAILVISAATGCRPEPPRPSATTQALIARAEAAERERRYDRARQLYARAAQNASDPHSRALASRTFARSLIAWGEYDNAAIWLERAVQNAPDDAGAWHDLGMVQHHRGDPDGAEAAFRRSIAARPDDPRSRIALAALLWRGQRYRDALREYRALAALDLPPPIRDKVQWAIDVLTSRDPAP